MAQKSLFFMTVIITLLSPHFSWGQSRLFSLFRTNYYTEKTMVYDLVVDNNCKSAQKIPLKVYFINTQSGQSLKDFSKQNQDYFYPRNVQWSKSDTLTFGFKALDEVGRKMNRTLRIQVTMAVSGGRCQSQVSLLSSQQSLFTPLKGFEVEFRLKDYGALGKHPEDILWASVFGSGKVTCLTGPCH